MSLASMLNATCTVSSNTYVEDATTGETKLTSVANATVVPCTVQALNTSESRTAMRETGRAQYEVFFLLSQTIGVTNTIRTISTHSGLVLAVTSLGVDDAGRGCYRRCIAEEITGEKGTA